MLSADLLKFIPVNLGSSTTFYISLISASTKIEIWMNSSTFITEVDFKTTFYSTAHKCL